MEKHTNTKQTQKTQFQIDVEKAKLMASASDKTWFAQTFGFEELEHLQQDDSGKAVRQCFDFTKDNSGAVTLVSKHNSKVFQVGKFESPSLAVLRTIVFCMERTRHLAKYPKTRLTFSHICDVDIGEFIREHPAAKDAVFQVASQFNALEMAKPRNTPNQGVTIYEYDKTQGPACALACPSATVYRNYFVTNPNGGFGQCGHPSNQLNLLDGMAAMLQKNTNTEKFWTVKNGYAFPASAAKYTELCGILNAMEGSMRDDVMASLRCAIQWDTAAQGASHRVSQVFCSALPLSYAPDLFTNADNGNDAWPKLILQGAYEFTILVAALAAMRRRKRVTCYITQLGGGAFGNHDTWIRDAVFSALNTYYYLPVNVVMVHYQTDIPDIYMA